MANWKTAFDQVCSNGGGGGGGRGGGGDDRAARARRFSVQVQQNDRSKQCSLLLLALTNRR